MTDPIESTDPRDLGRRLQAARKAAGRTQDELARHLGVARTTIVAMEKGERRIRPAELVELAASLGRRVSELVRPGPPPAPLAVQLRAVLAPEEPLVPALDRWANVLQQLCEDYVELERLCGAPLPRNYPPERVVRGLSPEQAAEDLAVAERQRLGLGDGPVSALRETLELAVGLRIFYLPLPSAVSAMFSFDETLGGCIAVNIHHPEVRRRNSLAHEYAHFLTARRQPTVEFTARYRRVPEHERLANAFAPAFLVPASGLTRRFTDIKTANNGAFTYADLLSLAHYFAVSVSSLTRRLEEIKLVRRGTADRVKESGLRVEEGRQLLNLAATSTNTDVLPARYILLAAQGFKERRLSEGQLARFLRVDRIEARRLVAEGVAADSIGSGGGELDETTIDRGPLEEATL